MPYREFLMVRLREALSITPVPVSIDGIMKVAPLSTSFPGPESFAAIDLGPETIPEIWITVKIRFGKEEIVDYLNSHFAYSKKLISIFHPPSSTFYEYIDINPTDSTIDSWLSNYWNIVEYHGLLNWDGDDHALSEWYINNELISSDDDTNSWDVLLITLGQKHSGGADEIYVPYPFYFDDFRVGTTRGAHNIFSDNFNSDNFDAWTLTEGLISIIQNPF